MSGVTYRLTQYASGGGCACKFPPGELEQLLSGLAIPPRDTTDELIVGLATGDDAAVGNIDAHVAVVATVDFFPPVVDDAYDWGRIAAANALSDIYAMGGRPLIGLNLVGWPKDNLPYELLAKVLKGGLDVASKAGCHIAGGHTIFNPEPTYGLSVTGVVDPKQVMRNSSGKAGVPLSLTKPLGIGVLNNRHKRTGETFPHAVETMATLNRDAAEAAVAAGITCATDVTGFGLLGHLYKLARASNVTAIIDSAAVPYLEGAREALRDGYVSGGTQRNLEWVTPHVEMNSPDALLLADAQTSGGLLLAGEIPGATVIGELVPRGEYPVIVR